jgi:hypothetical protein
VNRPIRRKMASWFGYFVGLATRGVAVRYRVTESVETAVALKGTQHNEPPLP